MLHGFPSDDVSNLNPHIFSGVKVDPSAHENTLLFPLWQRNHVLVEQSSVVFAFLPAVESKFQLCAATILSRKMFNHFLQAFVITHVFRSARKRFIPCSDI